MALSLIKAKNCIFPKLHDCIAKGDGLAEEQKVLDLSNSWFNNKLALQLMMVGICISIFYLPASAL